MTARLNQSGSSPFIRSEVVVERILPAVEPEQLEDRGRFVRSQTDLRGGALPERAAARDQLVDLVGLAGADAGVMNRHGEQRLLRRVRVERDGEEQLVGEIGRGLGVVEDAVVV